MASTAAKCNLLQHAGGNEANSFTKEALEKIHFNEDLHLKRKILDKEKLNEDEDLAEVKLRRAT